jgi:hypothetical protein
MFKNTKEQQSDTPVLARKSVVHFRQLNITVILLVMIVLLSACGGSAPEPDSSVPPDPTTLPAEAVKCDTGDSGEYICNGLSDHMLTVANVPENVSPYLLPVSPAEEEKLRQLPREDIGCIISIVGNMAFYDADNNLVTSFPSAVSLKYTLTKADNSKLEDCAQTLKNEGIVASSSEVTYVPIYVYNKPDMVTWKTFQDFAIEDGTVTINFTGWGDQQGGFGTKP